MERPQHFRRHLHRNDTFSQSSHRRRRIPRGMHCSSRGLFVRVGTFLCVSARALRTLPFRHPDESANGDLQAREDFDKLFEVTSIFCYQHRQEVFDQLLGSVLRSPSYIKSRIENHLNLG